MKEIHIFLLHPFASWKTWGISIIPTTKKKITCFHWNFSVAHHPVPTTGSSQTQGSEAMRLGVSTGEAWIDAPIIATSMAEVGIHPEGGITFITNSITPTKNKQNNKNNLKSTKVSTSGFCVFNQMLFLNIYIISLIKL